MAMENAFKVRFFNQLWKESFFGGFYFAFIFPKLGDNILQSNRCINECFIGNGIHIGKRDLFSFGHFL